jgi:hypothetical protein
MLFENLIKYNLTICLKKQEREFFRKLLENFIVKNPHFRQRQVFDHFV